MSRAALGLLLLAGFAAGCQRPRVAITPVFAVVTDGGAALGCEAIQDLGCVNFIKFQFAEQGSLTPSTQCIKVDRRLATLCDVEELARGAELFRHADRATVQIKMWGLRVFPATSCEINPDCREKVLFYGATEWTPIGDVAGGELPLPITAAGDCGLKEVYRPRGDRDCTVVCDFTTPVCALADGCVCLVPPDPDAPEAAGNWAPATRDAGPD